METVTAAGVIPPPPSAPVLVPDVDERAARRSLLDQIAKLETELSSLFCATYPRLGFEWQVRSHGGPRLLGLDELEQIRDNLADRLHENRSLLGDKTYVEGHYRRLIEQMMLEPAKHKWMRVGNEHIGEPGCKYWEVRPRLGIIGMMMGWWRVKISSGCPLPRPRRRSAAAAEWESARERGRIRNGRRRRVLSAMPAAGLPPLSRGVALASGHPRRGGRCR